MQRRRPPYPPLAGPRYLGYAISMPTATMQDVAARAGVSTATVSRALSTPDILTPATLEKVRLAIEALNYAPNLAGKGLRTRRTNRLLVTVPDISNPFYSSVIRGVEELAQTAGYAVLLGDTRHDRDREEECALLLRQNEADGMILLAQRLPQSLAQTPPRDRYRLPIVNGCNFNPRLGISTVHIDNVTASREAVEYLVSLGHTRIGIISGPSASPLCRDRLRGARTGGRGAELRTATGDFTIDSGEHCAGKLLDGDRPPTAFFCFSDEMAIGVISAAHRRGLRCPQDVSVVGFDDIRVAKSFIPPLTTIQQPMREIGRQTVKLMLEILGGRVSKPIFVTLPHQLIIRESTGPAPR